MDRDQQVITGHAIDTYEIVIMYLNPLKPSFSNVRDYLSTQWSKVGNIFF